tara:strand:+ start:31 stop:414 length:384 start_codon:yes stop_codon:yes gene_type:complete
MVSASGMLHSAESNMYRAGGYLKSHVQMRMLQIAVYSSILFYIVANPVLFEFVNKGVNWFCGLFKCSVKKDGQVMVVIHSLVFGLLLYVLSLFVFDPVLKMAHIVEGATAKLPKAQGFRNAPRRRRR